MGFVAKAPGEAWEIIAEELRWFWPEIGWFLKAVKQGETIIDVPKFPLVEWWKKGGCLFFTIRRYWKLYGMLMICWNWMWYVDDLLMIFRNWGRFFFKCFWEFKEKQHTETMQQNTKTKHTEYWEFEHPALGFRLAEFWQTLIALETVATGHFVMQLWTTHVWHHTYPCSGYTHHFCWCFPHLIGLLVIGLPTYPS